MKTTEGLAWKVRIMLMSLKKLTRELCFGSGAYAYVGLKELRPLLFVPMTGT